MTPKISLKEFQEWLGERLRRMDGECPLINLHDVIKKFKEITPCADGLLRAKIGAVVFHAARRALTETENMQITDMVLCPKQNGKNCDLNFCPYHRTRGTDSEGICHIGKQKGH